MLFSVFSSRICSFKNCFNMGNCLPHLRKNKVGPGDISEVLSRASTPPRTTNVNFCVGEEKMVEKLSVSEDDWSSDSLEAELVKTVETALDECKKEGIDVKKPVFFQVDFVQGMRNMPRRLASRMEQTNDRRKCEKMGLTDEDELLMDEIMEEYEREEKLKELEERLKAAEQLREQHLQNVRAKARGEKSRPPTRAC